MKKKKKEPVEIVAYVDAMDKTASRARVGLDRAVERLGNSVTIEYRFLVNPNSDQQNSMRAAKALLAASNQDRLIEMRELIASHHGDYSDSTFTELAQKLKLDLALFQGDYNSTETNRQLEIARQEADRLGATIAPFVTLDGRLYRGPWDEYAFMEAVENRGTKHIEIAMESFFSWGASAAFVLLFATLTALIFVNVGFQDIYESIKHLDFGFQFGEHRFLEPLEVWINDALMAIFFFLIGLEIKREIIDGELSDINKALMPIIGATGGMIVPALVYTFVTIGGEGAHGWGVPMATDIAFTLGLMALLGSKVSTSLKIFVSALAVADDLGAIVVIAIFYGHGFHFFEFGMALGILAIMAVLNYRRVYTTSLYIFLGLFLWYFIFQSGLHATLAGVLTAAFIPFRNKGDILGVATQTQIIFEQEIANIHDSKTSDSVIRSDSLRELNKAVDRLREPGYYLEHSLEKWVNYLVLPIFAFFNTGILVTGSEELLTRLFTAINTGIILGLCLGKPLGIFLFCWLASKLGIAHLSPAISWKSLLGAGCLAGVGFTMSIVVASTAFSGPTLDTAKLSILIASLLASVLGLLILNTNKR
ncbi:MAG: Na+/H+ antiporter NhaA [Bacteroidota bacterium]